MTSLGELPGTATGFQLPAVLQVPSASTAQLPLAAKAEGTHMAIKLKHAMSFEMMVDLIIVFIGLSLAGCFLKRFSNMPSH